MPSLDNIREDHGVEMTDMRGSIDIENWRSDVVGFLGGCLRSNISGVASATALTRWTDPWWTFRKAQKHIPKCRSCSTRYPGTHTFCGGLTVQIATDLPSVDCVARAALAYRVRASNAQHDQMRNPTTPKDHQNEVVEPHTTADITIFYSVVVIRYL